jgi:DNA-binding transcriptional LysR family regulator
MDAQLHVFETVAELRNFSRAAEKLHMTQPAVSQQVRSLEESLGVRLMERSNKGVTLTKAGELTLHYAKEINGQYRRMREMIDELLHFAGGPLAIGASYTFGEYALPATIARLHDEYPGILPSIAIGNTADMAERLRARELDLAIVEGNEYGSGLEAVWLANDRMYIAAGSAHPLACEGLVKPERLSAETWMVREGGSGTRAATDRMFASLGIHPARMMELGSTQLIKETVEAGLGVTLQSQLALRKELGLGSLKLLSVEGIPVKRDFHVLLREGELRTRTIEVFLQTLKEETERLLS